MAGRIYYILTSWLVIRRSVLNEQMKILQKRIGCGASSSSGHYSGAAYIIITTI
jgi:hypothetical protein